MKICKNCSTINSPEAESCVKCSMVGMLVNEIHQEKFTPSVKTLYPTCINCGTDETGKESQCQKCKFPLPKSKIDTRIDLPQKVKLS